MAPELPSRIDRYRILDRLGNGSMGDVYLAVDPKLDRRLALKVMSSQRLGEEDELGELRMRFVQEARAAGRLSHPGIVTVYDADSDEASGWPFIAMELVNGCSLRTRLRKGDLIQVDEAVSLIAQVARALDYAHGEGVVHRDIKPANLLLDGSGTQVKIADFGVAKLVSNSLTLTGQVLGSPNYMAPEQVKAEPVDGRTDLFGLGVVLYECLAGCLPFASDSLASITFKIVSVDPRPVEIYNPRVPPALGEIVLRALEKDPANRFQSGAEMADALEAVGRQLDAAPEMSKTRELALPVFRSSRSLSRHPSAPISPRDSPTTLGRRGAGRTLTALLGVILLLGVGLWIFRDGLFGDGDGDLPLLTRPLGVFAAQPGQASPTEGEGDAAPALEIGEAPASRAPMPPEPHREVAAEIARVEPPSDLAEDEGNTAFQASTDGGVDLEEDESPDEPAPGELSLDELSLYELPEDETAHGTSTEDSSEPAPADTAPVNATGPEELAPPPIPQTRLTVAVENKIKLAMISVWVDGERTLTRRLQTSSWLRRRVGHSFQFEVPVPIGRRRVEVHISGLSSQLEARGVIRAELLPGRAAILEVEIDRRRQKLNLSWSS